MNKKLSRKIEKVTNFIVSLGAAIVILGALAKLTHHRYADIMLTVGLVTEAAIFLTYAFLPPVKSHEEEYLAAILRETRQKESGIHREGQSATIDTAPIDRLNVTLEKIFNVK